MANVPIPVTISDITPSWIQLVMDHLPISDSLKINGDIQQGYGYLSSISRVSYKTPGDPPQSHSIIVKLLPAKSIHTDYSLCENVYQREIQFYNIALPDLLQALPVLEENVCKFYHGVYKPENPSKNIPHEMLLVMEDLKDSNYEMMTFSGDGSPRVLNSLIKFTARLHYASQVISIEKGKPLPELYPFLCGIKPNINWHIEMQEKLTDTSYSYLKTLLKNQNVSEDTYKRYEKLKPFTRKIYEKVEEFGKTMACMIHGDLWAPNIMVHKSLPVKALDWQFASYRHATFDLGLMLPAVLPREQCTKENMRDLLKRYWQEYEQLREQGEYKDKIKTETYDEFEETFFTWGIAHGFLQYLPFIDAFDKDFDKWANVLRVICEEIRLPEFLLKICTED